MCFGCPSLIFIASSCDINHFLYSSVKYLLKILSIYFFGLLIFTIDGILVLTQIFCIKVLYRYMYCEYCLPVCSLLIHFSLLVFLAKIFLNFDENILSLFSFLLLMSFKKKKNYWPAGCKAILLYFLLEKFYSFRI